MKAVWNDRVIAESSDIVTMEGHHYFPESSIDKSVLVHSMKTSVCLRKGTAHYYHLEADGRRTENAAWCYPYPKSASRKTRDRIAFGRGVEVR